jgi:hypothetical protein
MKRINGAQTYVEMNQYYIYGVLHTYHKFVKIVSSDKGPIKFSSNWQHGWATVKQAFEYFKVNGLNLHNQRTF